MKISMAQIQISDDVEANIEKELGYVKEAAGSDLLFFPEVQNAPFFPQHPAQDVEKYVVSEDSEIITRFRDAAKSENLYISPNFYIEEGDGKRYDRSLWINREGQLVDAASMVHIFQAPMFYEQDYYSPSYDGFKVFDTEFGKVGIVICFDRHIPESVRTCALKGADLVIIPTVNCKAEPMDLFEAEVRTLAYQNSVFIAMCNRVGAEDEMDFAGESIVVDPYGKVVYKADDQERLITVDIDLSEASRKKEEIPWLGLRRTEHYL